MQVSIKPTDKITPKRIESFWAKVNKTASCWEWRGKSRTKGGYGLINVSKMMWLAHRFAWFLTYNYQPELFLLHSCDNPICVNPEHLREGGHLENARDRVSRNRQAKGKTHGRTKLQEQDITEIERLYFVEKMPDWEIATKYGVSRSTISHVVHGHNWRHIERQYSTRVKTGGRPIRKTPFITYQNKSGYKGVYFHKGRQKYHARFSLKKQRFDCGFYQTAEQAAQAYDTKIKELLGEAAELNFPKPDIYFCQASINAAECAG